MLHRIVFGLSISPAFGVTFDNSADTICPYGSGTEATANYRPMGNKPIRYASTATDSKTIASLNTSPKIEEVTLKTTIAAATARMIFTSVGI